MQRSQMPQKGSHKLAIELKKHQEVAWLYQKEITKKKKKVKRKK
jgi:hypothetical protein